MEVQEDAKVGALVGVVAARDPDVKNKPVRYGTGTKSTSAEAKSPPKSTTSPPSMLEGRELLEKSMQAIAGISFYRKY